MPTYLLVHSIASVPAFNVPSWWGTPNAYISIPSQKGRDIATWAYSGDYTIPVNGSFSGIIKENNVAVPYCSVCIYYRPNGFLIAKIKADAGGNFTFTGLDPTVSVAQYFIVAFDPDGGVVYNALIIDRVLAV